MRAGIGARNSRSLGQRFHSLAAAAGREPVRCSKPVPSRTRVLHERSLVAGGARAETSVASADCHPGERDRSRLPQTRNPMTELATAQLHPCSGQPAALSASARTTGPQPPKGETRVADARRFAAVTRRSPAAWHPPTGEAASRLANSSVERPHAREAMRHCRLREGTESRVRGARFQTV